MRYAEASFWGDSAAIVLTSARATVHVSYAGVSFSRLGLEPCPGILFAIRMKGPHVDIGKGRIHGVYDLTHPAGRPDDSVALHLFHGGKLHRNEAALHEDRGVEAAKVRHAIEEPHRSEEHTSELQS